MEITPIGTKRVTFAKQTNPFCPEASQFGKAEPFQTESKLLVIGVNEANDRGVRRDPKAPEDPGGLLGADQIDVIAQTRLTGVISRNDEAGLFSVFDLANDQQIGRATSELQSP